MRYVTTLSVNEEEDGRPTILVEGKFHEGDALTAQALELSDAPKNAVSAWTLNIPNDGQENHTVRVLSPEENTTYTVYVREGEKWRKTDTEVNGSYICFTVSAETDFALVPATNNTWIVWTVIVVALVLIALTTVLLMRRRKRVQKPGRHEKRS